MKAKHAKRWTLHAVTCIAAGILPLTGFSQIHVDFQNDTIGDPPAEALWITANADVTVVDGESIFGAGNQSMLINPVVNTYVVFRGDEAYQTGTFTTELTGETRTNHTYIRLGNSSTGTGIPPASTAVNLHIRWGYLLSSWDANNNVYSFDQVLKEGESNVLVINFDSISQTWSGTIDGIVLTANNGETSVFDYANKSVNNVTSVDRVHWYSPTGAGGTLAYVNNIALIPEPSSAMIVGLSVLLLGLIRMRNRAT